MSAPRWPVTVLTGMLGSGKTTVLRALLSDPAMRGTAVLINEIGEIGLDHHLVEQVDGETVLLKSGCLCCTLKADLPRTLAGLRRRWLADGELDLARVVVETTGLARPGPILRQIATNPLIAQDFPLAGVVATVDGRHWHGQIARPEAREQLAMADLLLLTKLDIATDESLDQLRRAVARINPRAPILEFAAGRALGLAGFFASGSAQGGLVWESVAAEGGARHDHGTTLAARRDEPIDWANLTDFVRTLLAEGAPGVLRFKGIFDVVGMNRPVVLQAVQELLYAADTLKAWPEGAHGSGFVLMLEEIADRPQYEQLIRGSGLDWILLGVCSSHSSAPAGQGTGSRQQL